MKFFPKHSFSMLMLLVLSSDVSAQKMTNNPWPHELRQQVNRLSEQIEESPEKTQLYSSRGDARFFLGDFKNALADYSKMVELSPETDRSHWRRGIAFFYVGEFDNAAAQFDRYHSFDDVDRENGIWRYLSHFRSKGAEAARKQLLKYEKDDREPFGDVYRLFSGEMTSQEILDKINDASIASKERQKRLFYANLYIGLNEAVHDRKESALEHLKLAEANLWARQAGYGPNYMWQVARRHATLIQEELKTAE